MIGELSTDLLTAAKSITSNKFGTTTKRVGLAVGAKSIDPTLQKVQLPAAWIVMIGDQNQSNLDQGECPSFIKTEFIIKVFMDYTTETDLITNQYPLLEELINTINGRQGPVGAKKWKYEGQTLDELTGNRVVFDQRYSIVAAL
jgi:hypothetical protein